MNFAAGGTSTPLTVDTELAIRPEESGWKDTVNVAGRMARQTGK